MRVIEAGHVYALEEIDSSETVQYLTFIKREGHNYPGNVGTHRGVLTQEVLRACLDRAIYMNRQGSCAETDIIVASLQTAIMAFEVRAARCRGTSIELKHLSDLLDAPTCDICGHIQCDPERHNRPHWSDQ